MALITRPNGDVLSGVNQNTSVGSFISFNGVRLATFKIIVANASGTAQDVRTEGQAGEVIEAIVSAVMTRATPSYMQIEDDTTGQISMLIEGEGGWEASTLQTAIRNLGAAVGSNSVDVSGSTVTDNGLKLA
jgi:hypothetical protein